MGAGQFWGHASRPPFRGQPSSPGKARAQVPRRALRCQQPTARAPPAHIFQGCCPWKGKAPTPPLQVCPRGRRGPEVGRGEEERRRGRAGARGSGPSGLMKEKGEAEARRQTFKTWEEKVLPGIQTSPRRSRWWSDSGFFPGDAMASKSPKSGQKPPPPACLPAGSGSGACRGHPEILRSTPDALQCTADAGVESPDRCWHPGWLQCHWLQGRL